MHISRFTWIFSLFLMFGSTVSTAQGIVINEFMSDNESILEDDDGEFSDWIELYNSSSNAINVDGFYLSDNKEDLKKWKLPNTLIEANDFLILFASGKDKQNGNFIHTNFKISSDGEELILSNSVGDQIDEYEEIGLTGDRSFGRLPDGGTNKAILYQPSPGSSNNESNTISFSHEPGFYTSGFDLALNSLLDDPIYYTLDGSEPTSSSNLYTNQLELEDNTPSPNVWSEIPTTPQDVFLTNPEWKSPGFPVTKANIIRCATFRNNIQTSKTYSQTFLIASDVFDKYDMPIVSLITDSYNFFDEENGIYVPGIDYDPDEAEWSGNYFRRDRESERPVHIEYFDLEGNLGFSQDAGARIHGGKTRHGAQKSLKLYARQDYGEEYFSYQLMPQKNVTNYERFLLQTTTGAWAGDTVIKDILSHEIVRDMDFEKMDYQPVVVFLNGEYWGIHNIRDRMDEKYLAYTTGLDVDSVKIDVYSSSHFGALMKFAEEEMPIDNDEYEHISNQIEIDAFLDYQIAQMYLNNFDWPANNSKHWRPNKPGGKWRWMFYDIDGGFREHTYDMMVHNTSDNPNISWPNSPRSTLLFRALIGNEIFKDKFLARYKELMENDFQSSITKAHLNSLIDQYRYEMPEHIARWHFPASMESWLDDIDSELVEFLEKRSCSVVEHIESYFEMDDYDVQCKDPLDTVVTPISLVDLKVAPNPNMGSFSILNTGEIKRVVDITIINGIGKVISQFNNVQIQAGSAYNIYKSELSAGFYALNIRELERTYTIPVLILN